MRQSAMNFPQPRYAHIHTDPSKGEVTDLATKEMSEMPQDDEPFFLALVAGWCGHCQVKVDFLNNINTMHKLEKLKRQTDVIPRVEWIDAARVNEQYEGTEAQAEILKKLGTNTHSFPKWFLCLPKRPVEVPGTILAEAATSKGMQLLRAFYKQELKKLA